MGLPRGGGLSKDLATFTCVVDESDQGVLLAACRHNRGQCWDRPTYHISRGPEPFQRVHVSWLVDALPIGSCREPEATWVREELCGSVKHEQEGYGIRTVTQRQEQS